MQVKRKHIGFWISVLLFLAIVPYSAIEWFNKSIPFSPSLYMLSGISTLLLAFNTYYLIKNE